MLTDSGLCYFGSMSELKSPAKNQSHSAGYWKSQQNNKRTEQCWSQPCHGILLLHGLLLFVVFTAVLLKGSFIVLNLIYIYIFLYIYIPQKSSQSYQPDSHHLFFSSIPLGCKRDCPQIPLFLMILISFSTMSPKVYLTISLCSQFTYYCQLEWIHHCVPLVLLVWSYRWISICAYRERHTTS